MSLLILETIHPFFQYSTRQPVRLTAAGRGKPGDFHKPELRKTPPEVVSLPFFPLYSVLQALGNPTVNFFSLDTEGAEMPILRTIPFDKVFEDFCLF